MKRYLVIGGLCILVLILFACGKDSPSSPTTPNAPNWNEELKRLCALENSAVNVYDSLLAISDTTSAISATIAFLEGMPEIGWATYNDIDCIWFKYEDGGHGGILIRPWTHKGGRSRYESDQLKARLSVIPEKNGAIYVSPFYSEFIPFSEGLWATFRDELQNVGYQSESIVSIIDDEVTLEALTHLSNYGVIHLDSHGGPEKGPDGSIIEVWFTLSLPVDSTSWSDIPSHLRSEEHHTWTVLTEAETGIARYVISPEFLDNHNDWTPSRSLIWGGFCYSFLGTWPQTMTDAGASCYLGWTAGVELDTDAATATEFYEYMCDTPKTNSFLTTVVSFFLEEDIEEDMNLRVWGDPFTSLQEAVPTGWMIGTDPVTFGNAGAVYYAGDDSLVVSFYGDPFSGLFPAASFSVTDISLRLVGEKVPLAALGIMINETLNYLPDIGQYYPILPCYVMFTELDLRDKGHISGVIYGDVYEIALPISGDPPVRPVWGSFENLSIGALPLPGRAKQNNLASR